MTRYLHNVFIGLSSEGHIRIIEYRLVPRYHAELHISQSFFTMRCLLHLGWDAFEMAHRPVHRISLLSEFFCVRARHCTWQAARWRTATNSEGLELWSVRTHCHFRPCCGNCCKLQSGDDRCQDILRRQPCSK